MTTRFRVVVPFRDRESGATREVTITLTRAATLDCMHEAARRGMHPTRDGWPPLERACAIRQASLALGGKAVWNELFGVWMIAYPPGLEPVFPDVRRAPELGVIG
jgi:hypothetical protein